MAPSLHDRHDNLPTFKELPEVEGLPKGCTWGFWDRSGRKDELGTLNLLTPEVVKQAYKELKDGASVALGWSLTKPNAPNFWRKKLEHKLIDHADLGPYTGFDDEIHFNSQCSSQWDGFRHHAHTKSGLLYNYVKRQEIIDSPNSGVLGIDSIASEITLEVL